MCRRGGRGALRERQGRQNVLSGPGARVQEGERLGAGQRSQRRRRRERLRVAVATDQRSGGRELFGGSGLHLAAVQVQRERLPRWRLESRRTLSL